METKIKVGCLTLVGLIILAISSLLINKVSFASFYNILIEFQVINGLVEGDDVLMFGVRAGEVKRIRMLEKNVLITAQIKQEIKLPDNPEFVVDKMGLMGKNFIGIGRSKRNYVDIKLDDKSIAKLKKLEEDEREISEGSRIIIKKLEISKRGKKQSFDIMIFGKIELILGYDIIRLRLDERIPYFSDKTIYLTFVTRENEAVLLRGKVRYTSSIKVQKNICISFDINKQDFINYVNKVCLKTSRALHQADTMDIKGKKVSLNFNGVNIKAMFLRDPAFSIRGLSLFGFKFFNKPEVIAILALSKNIKFKSGDKVKLGKLTGTVMGEFFFGTYLPTMNDLMSEGIGIMRVVKGIGRKVKNLLKDDMILKVRSTLTNIEDITANARQASLHFATTARNIKKTSFDIKDTTANIKELSITANLQGQEVIHDVKEVTGTIREEVDINRFKIRKVVNNIKEFTDTLKLLAKDNKPVIDSILANVKDASEYIRKMFADIENKGREAKRIKKILKNVEGVSDEFADFVGTSSEDKSESDKDIATHKSKESRTQKSKKAEKKESEEISEDDVWSSDEEEKVEHKPEQTKSDTRALSNVWEDEEGDSSKNDISVEKRADTSGSEPGNKGAKKSSTLKDLKAIITKAKKMVDAMEKTRMKLRYSVFVDRNERIYHSDADFRIYPGERSQFFLLGSRDIGLSSRLDLQVGFKRNIMDMRFGVINSEIGFGLDFKVGETLKLGFDAFDYNEPNFNLYSSILFAENIALYLRVDDVFRNPTRNYNLGFETNF